MRKDTVSGSTEILKHTLKLLEGCSSLEDWYKLKEFLITSYSSMAIILNFVDFVEKNIKTQNFREEEILFPRKGIKVYNPYFEKIPFLLSHLSGL